MIIKNFNSIKNLSAIKTTAATPTSVCYTDYDGSSEYTDFGNHTSIDFDTGDSWTVGAWITPDTIAAGGVGIVSKGIDANNRMDFINRNTANVQVYLVANSPSTRIYIATTTNPFSAGVKSHVNVRYTGGGTAASVSVYVDKVLQAQTTLSDTLGAQTLQNNGTLQIGTMFNGYTSQMFDGKVSNLYVSANHLTTGQMDAIYDLGDNNGVDYSTVPGLVLHSKLDTLNPVDETGTNNGTSFNQDASNIVCV